MNPISLSQASEIEGAPDKAYLSRLSRNRAKAPGYFVTYGLGWQVDTDHPDWIAMLERRTGKKQPNPRRKKTTLKTLASKKSIPLPMTGENARGNAGAKGSSVRDDGSTAEMYNLRVLKLAEELRGKEIDNEIKEIELKKKNGIIMDFSIGEFLFFGFMEKIAAEKLRFAKKIEQKIELEIQAGINTKKTPKDIAREIVKLVVKEEEAIIREIKESQASDLAEWRADVEYEKKAQD